MQRNVRWGLLIGLGVVVLGIGFVTANATDNPFHSLPLAKQEIENNYVKLKQQSVSAPQKSGDTSLKPVQHEQLPAGILNDFTPPFRADDVKISNVWQKEVKGKLVQVYAGQVSNDGTQGVVVVRTTDADGVNTHEQRFLTPNKTGAVKIVVENSMKLSLKSEKGALYEFDVQANGLSKK